MAMKKHSPEQIVALLRQLEVEIANGKTRTPTGFGWWNEFVERASSNSSTTEYFHSSETFASVDKVREREGCGSVDSKWISCLS
ncbi:MAG: hypothetical protein WA755_11150 [Candidatus Acidiferrales bacterium]